jgi:hypothetical protein
MSAVPGVPASLYGATALGVLLGPVAAPLDLIGPLPHETGLEYRRHLLLLVTVTGHPGEVVIVCRTTQ